jgi:hypothetical protein
MSELLKSYNKEVIPMFLGLAESKEVMKEFMAADTFVQETLEKVKNLQLAIKEHVEETKSDLVREIKAYQTDIALACKACVKGSNYKAAEVKSYFAARASEKVSKVVEKGEKFQQLDSEIG